MRRTALIIAPLLGLIVIGLIVVRHVRRQAPQAPPKTEQAVEEPPLPPREPEDPLPPSRVEAPVKSADTGSVRVFVQIGGVGIAGARIALEPGRHAPHDAQCEVSVLRGATGEDGTATFEKVPAGAWFLHARHPRHIPMVKKFQLKRGETKQLTLSLVEGATIWGTVTDRDGRPVGRARASVLSPQTQLPLHPTLQAWSGAEGNYRIDGVPPGRVFFHVRHELYRPHLDKDVKVGRAGEVQRIDVVLEPGNSISGRVVTPEGTPLAGAYVGASNESASMVRADNEGRFEIRGLGDEPVNIFARHEGRVSYLRNVDPNAKEIEIVLYEPGSISGTVTAEGDPPAFTVLVFRYEQDLGRELLFTSKRFERPEGGAFTVPGIPAGMYYVSAEAPGFARAARAAITVAVGDHVSGVNLTLTPE